MKKILTLFTALIVVGSMMVVMADYYYRGDQIGWGASLMSTSSDGYYAYFAANGSTSNHSFKITTSTDWNNGSEYSCWYANPGFNSTDVTNMNDNTNSWDNNGSNSSWNNIIYSEADYYILFYFPGTTINPSSDPVICASTTLPDNSGPAIPDTYTVVGEVPGLNWEATNTANDMTEDNGVYSLTLTDVTLAAQSYQYKIAKNHSYSVAYPQSGNASFQVTTAGIYDVTFTLNLSASPEYSVTPTLKQAVVVIPTIKMNGTFADGTNWEETAAFTVAANEETASLTIENLPVGNYQFLVLSNGSNLGNGYTFHRDFTGASGIETNAGNMTLEADVAGDYTFTWTYEGNALSIGFPAEPTPEYVDIKFFAPRTEDNPWDHVYAYSYKGSRTFLGAWPGTEITSTKDEGWYTVNVRKGSDLIFTDYAGTDGDARMQTNNIENIQAAACYVPNTIDYEASPKLATVATDADCKVNYHIAGSKELFGGTIDAAVNVPLDENNQIVLHDVDPGTYKFKINIGNWFWALGGNQHLSDEEGCGTIATEVGVGDVGFAIDHTQDVTITYYPATQKICLGAETTKSIASISVNDTTVYVGKAITINATYTTDATAIQYEILSGSEYINIANGQITGVAEGTATVRASVAETANYLGASDEFTVTVSPISYYLKNKWNGGDWAWAQMTAAAGDKFRLENMVYGGSGINYNYLEDDADAIWKDYSRIKYMDGTKAKVVEAYDTINLVLDPANDTIWAEMVSKDVTVYTVAGNSLSLFYLGWAPTHPYKYTDMKKQADGTYKWDNGGEKATLIAGELKLKVIKDRDYANGSWPDGDGFAYQIQRSGEYEIAIHFDVYSKAIWIDTTCVKPLNIQMPLLLKGSWDNWTGAANLTLGGYNDKAIVTLSLTEGTYQFKLEDVQSKWYGDGQAFTRDHNSHRNIKAKEESATTAMTIQVDKAGEYLFTYFYDGEQLLVQYPAIVPAAKIAPIGGKFTINAKGDTAVFSRGNLQYNYESNAWYTAETQYEILGDLNLRFGDNTYNGSIDLFGWSSENSDFGKQWKYKDEEFSGAFVDWGTLFAGDEKEWSTLSKAEWEFLLARKKGNNKLWTMLAIGPDSLNGLALFPNDWEAPAGLTIKYGFYDLDNEEDYKANSFTYAQWEAMEAAGAVFLPLGGSRAGYYGNTWSGSEESSLSNPLANGYDWVDEANVMGYYWTTTINSANENQIQSLILPGWHNNQWLAPAYWARERRRGQSVRLVTRIPKVEWTEVRTELTTDWYYTMCLDKAVTNVRGGSIWRVVSKAENGKDVILEDVALPLDAGRPYVLKALADKLEVVYSGEAVGAPLTEGNNGLVGSFVQTKLAQSNDNYIIYNNELYFVNSDNVYVGANRAYLNMADVPDYNISAPAPGRRRIMMSVHGNQVATDIESIQNSEVRIQKVLIDGQLYILRGEKMYNASGCLVK